MTSLSFAPQASQAQLPEQTISASAAAPCSPALMSRVGEALKTFSRELSDDELEQHIDDLQWLYLTAYARYEAHHSPHDRDEALYHLHLMNEAILARSPAAQAARHAEFERRISEGVDYFQSDHALELGRRYRRADL